jgi:hypothetical protein
MHAPAAVPRPEYAALASHFRVLAACFDLPMTGAIEEVLSLVAATFEVVDRHVDAIPDPAGRATLGDAILHALREGDPGALVHSELSTVLAVMRSRLEVTAATDAFAAELARFFERTEVLRTTRSGAMFVGCIVDEARCAAEMTLLAVPSLRVPRFARFFRVLSEVANLIDKVHDVRGDRARGEIAVRAGPVLHVRLLAALAIRIPTLLLLARRPLSVVAWGARYLLPPSGRARQSALPTLDATARER